MSLEDDIRKALIGLEGTVPDGYFDELPGRIQRRLKESVMEVDMTTDGKNGDQGQVPTENPPPKKKEENTGLHDIKAMAQSARKRVSQRIITQSESEEQLLLSASNSMNQVVLPDPNKAVAVDVAPAVDLPRSETEERAARGGIPIWVYAAVAAVAVAAVVFFVIRGKKGDDTKPDATRVARGDDSAAAGAPERSPAPGADQPTPSAEPIEADGTNTGASAEPIMADPADPAAGGDPPAEAPGGGAASNGAASNGASGDRRKDREDRAADKPADPRAPAKPAKDPKTEGAKPDAVPPPAPKKVAPGDQKRSLDELLDEASGGAPADDKDPTKPAGPATVAPAKTDISRDEISSGMGRVLGRVQGCYDTHKESGTVMIAVTIDPGGSISSASATGKFGGTPTGACVAEAVKKARFPAWEGKPKKINYPFLLSP